MIELNDLVYHSQVIEKLMELIKTGQYNVGKECQTTT